MRARCAVWDEYIILHSRTWVTLPKKKEIHLLDTKNGFVVKNIRQGQNSKHEICQDFDWICQDLGCMYPNLGWMCQEVAHTIFQNFCRMRQTYRNCVHIWTECVETCNTKKFKNRSGQNWKCLLQNFGQIHHFFEHTIRLHRRMGRGHLPAPEVHWHTKEWVLQEPQVNWHGQNQLPETSMYPYWHPETSIETGVGFDWNWFEAKTDPCERQSHERSPHWWRMQASGCCFPWIP